MGIVDEIQSFCEINRKQEISRPTRLYEITATKFTIVHLKEVFNGMAMREIHFRVIYMQCFS